MTDRIDRRTRFARRPARRNLAPIVPGHVGCIVIRHDGSRYLARGGAGFRATSPGPRGKKSGSPASISMNDPYYQRRKPMTLSRNTWIAIGVLMVVAAIVVIGLIASGGGVAGGAY